MSLEIFGLRLKLLVFIAINAFRHKNKIKKSKHLLMESSKDIAHTKNVPSSVVEVVQLQRRGSIFLAVTELGEVE